MSGDRASGRRAAGVRAGRRKGAGTNGRRYLNTDQAAEYLGVSSATLIDWRIKELGPIYSKSVRKVIYDVRDIDEWVEAGKRRFTGEAVRT